LRRVHITQQALQSGAPQEAPAAYYFRGFLDRTQKRLGRDCLANESRIDRGDFASVTGARSTT
jgi:hypothetical protein